jgi:mitogen-activated protein kinase 1/3
MDERMTNFIVGSSYKPLDVIGEGAYGTVWSVVFKYFADDHVLTFF